MTRSREEFFRLYGRNQTNAEIYDYLAPKPVSDKEIEELAQKHCREQRHSFKDRRQFYVDGFKAAMERNARADTLKRFPSEEDTMAAFEKEFALGTQIYHHSIVTWLYGWLRSKILGGGE